MVKIDAVFMGNQVISNSVGAQDLFGSSRYGEKHGEKIHYSLAESLFLLEQKKMQVFDIKGKLLKLKDLQKKFIKLDKRFLTKYIVFKDLRRKGYVVKTALKFGADFRVYDKGSKGRGHSKWLCFCSSELEKYTWQEFSSRNRVANSTKKNLLISVVDEEADVTYWEVAWKKII